MNSEVYDEIKASLRVIKWMVGFVLAFVVHQLLHSSPPTTAAPHTHHALSPCYHRSPPPTPSVIPKVAGVSQILAERAKAPPDQIRAP